MNMEIYKLAEGLDSFNSDEVQNGIQAILEKGSNAVLDMTGCNYISSTGLRVLLYSKKLAASKGLKVCLVGMTSEVNDIMDVTGFSNFFETYQSLDELP